MNENVKKPLQVIKASAGSGKTYELTLEYIKLLLGEKNVETGEFNVAAKSSYSFAYSVSASITEARGTTVNVRIRANREDGISQQTITASRMPIVPMPGDSELS